VRLARAARKDRIPLRYVREVAPPVPEEDERAVEILSPRRDSREFGDAGRVDVPDLSQKTILESVRQAYVADQHEEALSAGDLQRAYEVAPGRFAVLRSEELRRLRQPTSTAMEVVRSVRMSEIDPVFLETSYYILPGNGGEHSYGLFYRALKESGYAALAEVAMHGRQHVVVIRSGVKGLIRHSMFYVNEVRGAEEYATEATNIAPKERHSPWPASEHALGGLSRCSRRHKLMTTRKQVLWDPS
jgi:Ku70/Ku80 beta-barrel domain